MLSEVGVLTLAAIAVYSIPLVMGILRDPTSHEAQDAGMTAIFVLIPVSMFGIGCLLLAYLLWQTRAGAVMIVTAVSVVALVALTIAGIPMLVPAIGVALGGTVLALWFLYLDCPD